MGILISQGECPMCPTSDAGTVYNDGFKCFSCGYSTGGKARADKKIEKNVQFPPDYTPNIDQFSFEALHWLYSHYISDQLIRKYRIGYSRKSKRVVIPTIIDGVMVSYTARKLDTGPSPKYITHGSSRGAINILNASGGLKIAVVEDMLSAIRVAEFMPCLCLGGTHMSKEAAKHLTTHYTEVVLYLDGDEPGRKAAKKIEKLLTVENKTIIEKNLWKDLVYGTIIRDIYTDKDPKCYTTKELKEIL